jgi:hypothetical protein
VVKRDTELTSPRVIEKKNLVAGGSDSELAVVYDSVSKTLTINVYLTKSDTEGLTSLNYYYDILEEIPDDLNSGTTLFMGSATLEPTVQSPSDGVSLPENSLRYAAVTASDFNDNDIIVKKTIGGIPVFTGQSPAELNASLPVAKRYVNTIDMDSGVPTPATPMVNTIGAIDWQKSTAGILRGTLTGAFPNTKTFVSINNIVMGDGEIPFYVSHNPAGNDYVEIEFQSSANPGVPADVDLPSRFEISIEVFPA